MSKKLTDAIRAREDAKKPKKSKAEPKVEQPE